MVRSILAVLTGYLIFATSADLLFQISKQDPHQTVNLLFGLASTLYGMAFAMLGGYVAGRIASRSPRVHGAIISGVTALGALASLIARPGAGAIWSELVALFLMAPMAVVGSALTPRRRTPQ